MRRSFINLFQYMACALTQGYPADCRDSVGGAKFIHIIAFDDVTAITTTAGKVTAITKATGKRFWKYMLPKETGYGKSTVNANPQNGTTYWAQEVMLAVNKMTTNMSTEIRNVAAANLLIVVTDQNGAHWLYGAANGMQVSGGESGTGTAPGDRNGYSLTFTSNEPAPEIEVDATAFATLETAGA